MTPHRRGFCLLQMQYFATTKQKCLGFGWFFATTTPRPGQQSRPSHGPQIRFSSNNNNDKWYDWYKRLRVHPKASEKELRNAYYKRAKVEHTDIDKTPGAKARFQNASRMLKETYENLCDPPKRKQHDQERLDRQKAAAAEAARMVASHPSVADALRAKWKEEEEFLRRADELRKREVRKNTPPPKPHASTHDRHPAQEQRARPQKTTRNGPRDGSEKPKYAGTEHYKEAAPKEQQPQAQPEETEESRRKQQKMAEEQLARKAAAAKQKKMKRDADKKKTEEKNRLRERVIIIRGLPPRTRLEDVFDPLIKLAPGPVFRAKLWSNNMAEIEFCTDEAAREVLALANKGRLSIKDNYIYNPELARSKNELPVIGRKSRVLGLRQMSAGHMRVNNESLPAFLKRFDLEVERIVKHPPAVWPVTVYFASWTDADRAMRLLAKYQPRLNVCYRPDPCGMKDHVANSRASEAVKLSGSGTTEQERTGTLDTVGDLVANLVFFCFIYLFLSGGFILLNNIEESAEPEARGEKKSLALTYREQMIRRFYGPWKKESGIQGPE